MKFALLGDDPVVLPLVRAIVANPEHLVTRAALLGDLEAKVLETAPALQIVGWEELLTGDLSAVIVCGSEALIGEAAKQLAASGRALVVFPQGAWDTELIYELSLLRDDNGVLLLPVCPLLEHPLFRDLKPEPETPATEVESASQKSSGILHLRCEREVELSAGTELNETALRKFLLPDVGLLRRLGGEYYQVTAVQSATPAGGIVTATVTLTGENLPDAIWTIRPVSTPSRWQLTVTRDDGPTVYQATGADWNIQELGGEKSASPQEFEPGVRIREFVERGLTEPNVRPDWTDLTRDFEVLDAVRRSLARRRTIDLHFETASERSLFKTQMTAIGCGVLLLTLLALIGVLFLGSVLDTRGPVERGAEQAETIFYADEFAAGQARLTPSGKRHWDRIEDQKHDPAIPILVEETDDEKLSAKRREDLIARLEREGIPNAKQRVEVYSLEGPWLAAVMQIARILVFLPLFVFLGLQTLLFITRPAQSHRKNEKNL